MVVEKYYDDLFSACEKIDKKILEIKTRSGLHQKNSLTHQIQDKLSI